MPDRALTQIEFQEKINKKYPNRFTILKYINCKEKCLVKCNLCGYITERNPINLMQRGTCANCNLIKDNSDLKINIKNAAIKSINDYLIKNNLNNEYKIDLNTIINCSEKSKFFHCRCNKEFYMTIEKFKNKRRCPFCQHPHSRKDHNTFIAECKEKFPDYTILSKYETRNSEISIKHEKCGHIFNTKAYIFLAGHGCPLCNGGTKLLNKAKAQSHIPEDFELLEYSGRSKKAKFLHKKCNNSFFINFSSFIKYAKCPHCEEKYYNEKVIKNILKENNIEFESQKRFSNCKNINELPFDFFIPKYNLLLEYDGEQHYFPIYGKEKLKKQKNNDRIKTKFCKDNNFLLLRIPFWERNNLEKILKNYFLKNNITLIEHTEFLINNIKSFTKYKEENEK